MKISVKSVCTGVASLVLSLALTPAHAEPQKVDFDQGVDTAQVLEVFRRQTQIISIDTNTLIPVQSALNISSVPKFGPITGIDTVARVQNSEPYAAALEYPPLIEVLEPADRDPLLAQWKSINSERTGLLSEANAHETEDWKLYDRALAIDENAERLNNRQERLSAEIDNFNRQCTGRPLPPDEYDACLLWQTDLRRRIQEHNAEVVQHNNKVEQWRREAADLINRVGANLNETKEQKNVSFIPRVIAWEQKKIVPFSAAAATAIRRRNVSTIRLQAQRGFALDAREPFSKPGLITLSECLATDDRLWAKLTPSQQRVRLNARMEMRDWMRRAAAGGGSGPTKQINFYDKYPHTDDDPRFDLQVIRGRACVPDDCCQR